MPSQHTSEERNSDWKFNSRCALIEVLEGFCSGVARIADPVATNNSCEW